MSSDSSRRQTILEALAREPAHRVETPREVALMQLAAVEAISNLAAHWGQTGKMNAAEILHGVVDELLDLDAKLEPDEWPIYHAARYATAELLKKVGG